MNPWFLVVVPIRSSVKCVVPGEGRILSRGQPPRKSEEQPHSAQATKRWPTTLLKCNQDPFTESKDYGFRGMQSRRLKFTLADGCRGAPTPQPGCSSRAPERDEKRRMRLLGEHHEINRLPDSHRSEVERVESAGRRALPHGGGEDTSRPSLLTVGLDQEIPKIQVVLLVLCAAASLAASQGVGRFVYTPILPLMISHAGLSPAQGAVLATANYGGYLVGALVCEFARAKARSRSVLRMSLILLIATLAAMPVTHQLSIWCIFRFWGGFASAVVLVYTMNSLLTNLRGRSTELPAWGLGGIGGGIVLSGVLVLAVRAVGGDWQTAWWASAVLVAVLTAVAWVLLPPVPPAQLRAPIQDEPPTPGRHRLFAALLFSYTLEGFGYIIAGTFLVAAIEETSPGGLGNDAWVIVGLVAVPSAALWGLLGRRWSQPKALLVALVVQTVGIVLAALSHSAALALFSAAIFGVTFVAIAWLSLATGAQLGIAAAVAGLTVGYSVGQFVGPIAVTPLLHGGYRDALLLAAAVIAVAAAVLGFGLPHTIASHPGAQRSRTHSRQSDDGRSN
jgi:MFS family permease